MLGSVCLLDLSHLQIAQYVRNENGRAECPAALYSFADGFDRVQYIGQERSVGRALANVFPRDRSALVDHEQSGQRNLVLFVGHPILAYDF